MGEERIPLPRIEGYDCFGCGTNNPPVDEPVVGPQPLTTCLPEGVHNGAGYGVPTLAIFDVPETEEAIYLGTLMVEVTVRVLLDLSIDELATDICVRSVGIFDEIEAQTKDLRDAYPGTRMAPVTRLMITEDQHLWMSDADYYRFAKFDLNGQLLTYWGVFGRNPGEFDNLHSWDVDASGNLFTADGGNNRIQKFVEAPEIPAIDGFPGDGGENYRNEEFV